MYENLVIEGGGAKIYAFCGAIRHLEEKQIIGSVKKFVGTSSGSILCLFLILGYTTEEIYSYLCSLDTDAILSTCFLTGIYNLNKTFGYYNTNSYLKTLEDILIKKNISKDLTFSQLKNMTGKELIVTATCLNKRETHYYHSVSNPDMSVVKAIRISTCIPFVFGCVSWNDDILVDGAVSENYPIYAIQPDGHLPNSKINKISFDENIYKGNSKTIGLKIITPDEKPDDRVFHGNDKINSLAKFGVSILNMMSTEIDRNNIRPGYWEQTIQIKIPFNIPNSKLKITRGQKDELFNSGKISAELYFTEYQEK
jgi:hypothetical protein